MSSLIVISNRPFAVTDSFDIAEWLLDQWRLKGTILSLDGPSEWNGKTLQTVEIDEVGDNLSVSIENGVYTFAKCHDCRPLIDIGHGVHLITTEDLPEGVTSQEFVNTIDDIAYYGKSYVMDWPPEAPMYVVEQIPALRYSLQDEHQMKQYNVLRQFFTRNQIYYGHLKAKKSKDYITKSLPNIRPLIIYAPFGGSYGKLDRYRTSKLRSAKLIAVADPLSSLPDVESELNKIWRELNRDSYMFVSFFDVENRQDRELATLELMASLHIPDRELNQVFSTMRSVKDWIIDIGNIGFEFVKQTITKGPAGRVYTVLFKKVSKFRPFRYTQQLEQYPREMHLRMPMAVDKVFGSSYIASDYLELLWDRYMTRKAREEMWTGDGGAWQASKLKDFLPTKAEIYLDVGTGDGFIAQEIGKLVRADTIYGMDKENFIKAEIEPLIGPTLSSLNLPADSIDLITARYSIHHIRQPEDTLREIYRLLKLDGTFVLQDHDSKTFADEEVIVYEHMCYSVLELPDNMDRSEFVTFFDNYKQSEYYDYKTAQDWTTILEEIGFTLTKIDKYNTYNRTYAASYKKRDMLSL